MDFPVYFSALTISFSGLFVGLMLAHISKEELKIGKLFFQPMQSILLLLAILVCLFSLEIHFILAIILSCLMMLLILIFKKRYKVVSPAAYVLLGILSYLASKTGSFPYLSALSFLYGLPTGSLLAKSMIDMKVVRYSVFDLFRHIIRKYSWYLIVALVLFVIY
ncbi:MAG: hypothetical protein KKF44_11090 [Nanoarchaeota archaeon]|nr:hypothetical protein [Nanoarchaeota archaeon]